MELAHTRTVEEILAEFKVAEEEGLDNAHVEEQRRKHGLNGKSKGKIMSQLQRHLLSSPLPCS